MEYSSFRFTVGFAGFSGNPVEDAHYSAVPLPVEHMTRDSENLFQQQEIKTEYPTAETCRSLSGWVETERNTTNSFDFLMVWQKD